MSTIKVQNIQHTASSTNAIALASDGTCTANITNNLSNRRLTINGDMRIAQRGTSGTDTGYQTVDRFQVAYSGTDEAPTQSQVDIASGTTPYSIGFRKAYRATNGNQTSGAGAGDQVFFIHKLEARDIATSGWNYTDSNSFITLSFWVKSSVAQNFHGYLLAHDGTQQKYPYETGSLSANTWTKVTKTIPGNSNLQFDTDTETNATSVGLHIILTPYLGTDYTDSGVSLNTWSAYASGTRTPDQTSTWYTTNDATLEITGVQLEVGSVATDFEFEPYATTFLKCQRYYQTLYDSRIQKGTYWATGYYYSSTIMNIIERFHIEMRATPTFTCTSGTNFYRLYRHNTIDYVDDFVLTQATRKAFRIANSTDASGTQGSTGGFYNPSTESDLKIIAFEAEL